MPKENDGTLVTLEDEDGNKQEFEHLATLQYKGSDYVALVPYFEHPEELVEDDGDLVILKIIEENGEELLSAIEDDDEFNAVAEKFEDMLAEEYEIHEEDE